MCVNPIDRFQQEIKGGTSCFCCLYQYNRHMSDVEPDLNPVIEYVGRAGDPRRLVIRLDPRSGVPRFEQLRAQLSVMVAVALGAAVST